MCTRVYNRWKTDVDDPHASDAVYVNVYESGKCSVLAVPGTAVDWQPVSLAA